MGPSSNGSLGTINDMFALAGIVVWFLLEIYVMIKVAQQIGVLYTLGLLIGLSFVGAWLAKRAGFATYRRLRQTLNTGGVPTNEVIDGVMILAGGLLLFVPGFVSDAFALLLLLPPTRAGARGLVKRHFHLHHVDRYNTWRIDRGGPRYEGPDDVIDV